MLSGLKWRQWADLGTIGAGINRLGTMETIRESEGTVYPYFQGVEPGSQWVRDSVDQNVLPQGTYIKRRQHIKPRG